MKGTKEERLSGGGGERQMLKGRLNWGGFWQQLKGSKWGEKF